MAKDDGQLYANEDGWSDWVVMYSNHLHTCCDCGLVHDVQYRRVHRGLVRERWRVNERLTDKERKKWHKRKGSLWQKFFTTDPKTGHRHVQQDAWYAAIGGLRWRVCMLLIQVALRVKATQDWVMKRWR